MSEYLEGLQLNSTFPEGPAIEVRAPLLKELVRTRIQLMGAPYLQEQQMETNFRCYRIRSGSIGLWSRTS